MNESILILGGGIGGLTAGLELSRRGYRVRIVERETLPGGKSRSMPVPGSATGGRQPLPGEHGFRFFPGFYQHLPDTLASLPFGPGRTCFDNLVATREVLLTRFNGPPVRVPARFPANPGEFLRALRDLLQGQLGLAEGEARFFSTRLWEVMTSCRERREQELELRSWWDFVGAEARSANYQRICGEGLSRSLVAARAKEASARTIGQIQVHLFSHVLEVGGATDRVLCGPTSEMMLDPWIAQVRAFGGVYDTGLQVTALKFAAGRITGVDVTDAAGATTTLTADFYVAALPIEAFARLVTVPMQTAEPSLGSLPVLARDVRWMNGVQFYLNRNVRVNHGHTLHVDTPWALTSISQAQFWPGVDLTQRGDGQAKGILSVVISDFETDGLGGFKARQAPTAQALADEVWEQLKRSLQHTPFGQLSDADRRSFFVDPALTLGANPANQEPLFINRPNSWGLRPKPFLPGIPNLLLAADYVQCNADLACMEAACEAGRVAVNFILAATNSRQPGCRLFPMDMPPLGAPFRVVDRFRFAAGLPWDFEV